VEGTIVRLTNFGAFVEIEEGVEGLLHVSELDEERVEKPEDKLKVGETHRMKIIKMSEGERKVGLSIRAVDMDIDPAEYEAQASSSGSPNATLGDFADLSGAVISSTKSAESAEPAELSEAAETAENDSDEKTKPPSRPSQEDEG
jgi:small subunit ribosomal protein S1